ncbi:hypothetical protein PCE1_001082 [Barthelona sp. PCE]
MLILGLFLDCPIDKTGTEERVKPNLEFCAELSADLATEVHFLLKVPKKLSGRPAFSQNKRKNPCTVDHILDYEGFPYQSISFSTSPAKSGSIATEQLVLLKKDDFFNRINVDGDFFIDEHTLCVYGRILVLNTGTGFHCDVNGVFFETIGGFIWCTNVFEFEHTNHFVTKQTLLTLKSNIDSVKVTNVISDAEIHVGEYNSFPMILNKNGRMNAIINSQSINVLTVYFERNTYCFRMAYYIYNEQIHGMKLLLQIPQTVKCGTYNECVVTIANNQSVDLNLTASILGYPHVVCTLDSIPIGKIQPNEQKTFTITFVITKAGCFEVPLFELYDVDTKDVYTTSSVFLTAITTLDY